MIITTRGLPLLMAGAMGCGSAVVVSGGEGGLGDGDGGAGGNEGTSSGMGAAGGAGAACGTKEGEGFEAALALPGGEVFDCSMGTPLSPDGAVIEGVVTAGSLADGVEIDACPPSADCTPLIARLSVDTPGLSATIPTGTFVRVALQRGPSGDGVSTQKCGHSVVIVNLASWDGVANPTEPGERLWFVGHHAHVGQFDEPVEVSSKLVCEDDGGSAGQLYDLVFAAPEATATATAAQASSASWTVESGPQAGAYTVRNLNAALNAFHPVGETRYWIERAD